LNVELLQEGLARGSSTGTSRYGEVALLAFSQAQALKLNIWSGEKDPDFFYGESTEIDLKELRLNIKQYENTRVAFEGIVAYYLNQGVYVESFDEETGMYFGIYVYYGFTSISAQATNILAIGNKVRITGVVQYYEGGQSYQVADLKYNKFIPSDDDIRLLEQNAGAAAHVETSATKFASAKTISVTTTDAQGNQVTQDKVFKYAQLALNTSISMKDLTVVDIYTTSNGGDNDGAMTLTCTSQGVTVMVRTVVLRDYLGNKITAEQLQGKTIDVKGIVDFYDGDYQIKVMSLGGLSIQGEPWPTPPMQNPTSSAPAEEKGCGSVVTVSYVLPMLLAVAFIKKRKN
jgi:DNA/RNA endonuclease YhcR with UshA esterase domain